MRYLGIDYGLKNVGIAISDEEGKIAFPLSVLKNNEKLVSEISKICSDKKVRVIVVGESKDFSQEENPIMENIKEFITELKEKTSLPIELHPEFLTSVEAEKIQGKNEMHDASAAALILKSYLESHKNNLV